MVAPKDSNPGPSGNNLIIIDGGEDTYGVHCDFEASDGTPDEINMINNATHNDAITNRFDHIVGHLEDLVLTDAFETLQSQFCRQHCHHFENTDENKLIYTEIFEQYTTAIEGFLDQELSARVPGFVMNDFLEMLMERQDELAGEMFDLLLSLSDFETFKEVMLSYRQEGRGEGGEGMSVEIIGPMAASLIHVRPLSVHAEEQEDGDERADLDSQLVVSPFRSADRGGQ